MWSLLVPINLFNCIRLKEIFSFVLKWYSLQLMCLFRFLLSFWLKSPVEWKLAHADHLFVWGFPSTRICVVYYFSYIKMLFIHLKPEWPPSFYTSFSLAHNQMFSQWPTLPTNVPQYAPFCFTDHLLFFVHILFAKRIIFCFFVNMKNE